MDAKPLLAAVAGTAILGAAAVGTYAIASPGGEQELVQQAETATPTATSSNNATPSPSAAPSPSATPLPQTAVPTSSPRPVPEGWILHEVPGAGFSIAYPPDWFVASTGSRVASFALANWDGNFPPGGVAIDFDRIPLDQASPRPADATDRTVGAEAAWEVAGPREDMGGDATWESFHFVAVERLEYRYYILGYFGDAVPDKGAFQQIAESFRFNSEAE